MANKRQIGSFGENIALEYLKQKNYEILKTNYVKNHGEIDLITSIEDTIVFVEVKYRTNLNFGHPLESISQKKVAKLIETANLYLIENNIDKNIRFDVISILMDNGTYNIEHIVNAF